jgi:iron complex outermembrane receptor protein
MLQRPCGPLYKIHFKAEVDAYSTQNKFYALDDTETSTPGYALFNVSAGATIKSRTEKTLFELFLQADNLFDTAYQSNLNRLKYFEYYQSSPNRRSGIYNMGRNISFKIIVPF